jgi:triosephosphate isomerase (TIM)
MRRPLVAGNWKMNGSRAMAAALTKAIIEGARLITEVDVVLCPPAPYLNLVADLAGDSDVQVGAQDCSDFEGGAYTGETAASMLRDVGCSYVIIGHSERRQYFGDTDQRTRAKIQRARALDLTPVFCIGETLDERERNETEGTVGRQLDAVTSLPDAGAILRESVIAYEPVWAIGTGLSATPEQAQAVHAWIRERLGEIDGQLARSTRILYGGSVKPDNAKELFAMPDIDGGLIGGAALAADSFISICRAAV